MSTIGDMILITILIGGQVNGRRAIFGTVPGLTGMVARL